MNALHRFSRIDPLVPGLMAAGLLAAIAAPLIFMIELFEWWTRSEWPGLTLADGLSLFGIEHEVRESASQRLADLLMAAPLAISLFVTGVCTFLAGASLGSWEKERRLYAELSDRSLLAWLTLWRASDVGYPAAVRLLLLDLIVTALAWLGMALIGGEFLLLALGVDLRWLGLCGFLLLAAAFAARGAMRRKLRSPGGRTS
ncbi:MAG: hypothetical protein WBR13_00430 [Allosphingosinicella sp.]